MSVRISRRAKSGMVRGRWPLAKRQAQRWESALQQQGWRRTAKYPSSRIAALYGVPRFRLVAS